MWVVKQIIEWLIGKVFSTYYKITGYAGIFLLVLIVECIGLAVYRDDALGMVEVHESKTIIADARLKTEENNPETYEYKYEYELLLENHGSKSNYIPSIHVENQEEYSLSSEIIGVYQEAENWAKVGREDSTFVPAGSQAKVTVLVKSSAKVEKLIFTIGDESHFEVEVPSGKE
ncbi:MAG: hypothetical protein HDR22_05090 [Lachnospiraceae bacterium]|nr:hypothetical protein [Lachnospiraceae bacterium]